MRVPLEISCRGVNKSQFIESLVNEKMAKIEKICDYATSCHVAIEKHEPHQRNGSPYRVRIALRIPPNHEVVVRREAGEGDGREGLGTVLRDSFTTVIRQLQKVVDKQRGEVKTHAQEELEEVISEPDEEDLLSVEGTVV